jgi:hypothetical protein
MNKAQNKINNEFYQNENIIPNPLDNQTTFNFMKKTRKSNDHFFKIKAMEAFEKYNKEYLEKNPEDFAKYEKIIKENASFTPQEKQDLYWNKLKNIISSPKKIIHFILLQIYLLANH